jgi:hypothetical protein
MEQITYVHQEINWIIMGLIRLVKKINKQTAFIATAVGKMGIMALHYWVLISGRASEITL